MDRETIAALLRAHAAELRARGVTRLDLFGSTARGEATETSDIDVVIDVAPGRKFSLLDLAGLRAFLCELLGRETEPRRVSRRHCRLSHAAMAGWSAMA
ncbi:MAG: hypothetical protein FJX68_11640 [Alphaproteobacteria bacterium]|nr:hypothetical protein [Alphaproteobacteria bacterium]